MITIKIFRIGLGVDVWKLNTNIGWNRGDDFGILRINLLELTDQRQWFTVLYIKAAKFSIDITFELQ
jgi:hypothetical protein